MTDKKSGFSASTLAEARALAEASAFRITPTYVYAYKHKDNLPTGELVVARIKHANVGKHWDDLVDPPLDSPLNNLVIGTIPKHYKASSDLQLKDKSKSISDVMTHDGPSDEAQPISAKPQAAAAPGDISKADINKALSGGVPLEVYLKTVGFDDPAKQAALLKNPQITAVLLKQYGADWKEKAAAAGFNVPGAKPLIDPLVQNAASVLGFKPGTQEHKVLELLHKHGSDALALDDLLSDDMTENEAEAACELLLKVVDKAKKKKLITMTDDPDDDGVSIVKFDGPASQIPPVPKPIPAPAPAPVAPPVAAPVTPPAPPKPAADGYADIQAVFSPSVSWLTNAPEGITLIGPTSVSYTKKGNMWDVGGSILKIGSSGSMVTNLQLSIAGINTSYKVIAPAPFSFAPAAATAPPPKPVQAAAPAVLPTQLPIPPKGLGLPSVPPLASLQNIVDAKSKLGGIHDKYLASDGQGNTFLAKPSPDAMNAYAAQAYSNIAAKVFGPDNYIPVVAGNIPGIGFGSVQPMVPNIKTDLSKVDLKDLTPAQMDALMRERVLDWALASHDTKAANFVMTQSGQIVGVDKDQALKFVGKDSLDTSYKPNPTPQIYSALFDGYKKKKLNFNIGAMLPAIQAIEAMSDDAWMANLSSYIDARATTAAQKTALKSEILKRKKNLRSQLEGFLTAVLRERGDIGMTATFEFPTSSAGVASPSSPSQAPATPATPTGLPPLPSLPDFSSLSPMNMKVPGATGATYFYQDAQGSRFVVKQAVTRMGPKLPQPFRVASQMIAAQVGNLVRLGKVVPVAPTPVKVNGYESTYQPWIDNASVIGGTTPSQLKDTEKTDIASEHVVDWMTSQHDTHGDNLLRRPDGSIVGIDKEQGFKFFLDGDKLSSDYWPNKGVGPEPYYNKFWRAFADGSMDFDPLTMKGAIERAESISDADYTALLSTYASAAPFANDTKKVAEFITKGLERKKNIRKEFETFLTDLYRKRKKDANGTFSFAGGWSSTTGSTAAPSTATSVAKSISPAAVTSPVSAAASIPATGGNPFVGPKKAANGTSLAEFSSPAKVGAIGALNPKMVTAPAPVLKETKPVTPPGLPEPPTGKMWDVKTFDEWKASYIYKEKKPKDANGNEIASSDKVLLKLKNLSVADAQMFFSKNGVESFSDLGNPPVFSKGGYTIALVSKAQWDAANAAKAQQSNLVDIPAPVPITTSDQFSSIPESGQLGNLPANVGSDVLHTLADNKQIGYGVGFMADGDLVEQMSIQAQRLMTPTGPSYRFSFKLREPAWKALQKKGKQSTYTFPNVKYDEQTDAWTETGSSQGELGTFTARSVETDGSTVHIGVGNNSKRAYRGLVIADVRPQPGESVHAAFARTMAAVDPSISERLLKTPSVDEVRLLKASALHWSYLPKEADALAVQEDAGNKSARTFDKLMADLKKKGFTEKDVDSVVFEQTALGQSSPVLPGRLARIKKNAPVSHIAVGCKADVEGLVSQVLGASAGIIQRSLLGLDPSGSSVSDDLRTGGGEYLFGRVVTQDGSHQPPSYAGSVTMIYDPSELERLDSFIIDSSHVMDGYGCCFAEDSAKGAGWKHRPVLDEGIHNQLEIMLRKGVSSRKLLKISVDSASFAAKLIAALKAKGVTTLNGMTPEELVTVKGSPSAFYAKQLKPAGY